MPVDVRMGWEPVRNTIPYPPFQQRGTKRRPARDNRGFTDLRGRPDIAETIAEAVDSPELRLLLRGLATRESELFTLGCDIGTFVSTRDPQGPRHATGGYVQVLAVDYTRWDQEAYKALAERIAVAVEAHTAQDHWQLGLLLQEVQFNLDGHNDLLVSLSIEFNAWADEPEAARFSRERLVRTIRSVLMPFHPGTKMPECAHNVTRRSDSIHGAFDSRVGS